MKKISGILPPVLTPFKKNGDVNFDAFSKNLQKWNGDKLGGYLILGSNSETVYLTDEEKVEILKLGKEVATPDRFLMAGTGCDSIRETIRQTNKAAEIGYDAALVLTPFYYSSAMNDKAIIKYFTEVADASDIPVLIYNVPKFTHVNVPVSAVKTLSQHPNIVGMKDSTGDVPQMATWKRTVPDDFNLIVGTASALFPALTLGVNAGILALANTHPNECTEVMELFHKGETEKSYNLYQKLFPINTAITATYGIAGLKYMAELCGYIGGHVRSPLSDVGDEAKAQLEAILKNADL